MAEKRAVIRHYLERYELRVMVETGLYQGRGSGMEMHDLVDTLYLIDNDPANCTSARTNDTNAIVVDGDSATVLPGLLAGLRSPALFWLDAHSWVGEEFGDDPLPSPLLTELDGILAWPHAAQSVVLIDDIRQMADQPLVQPGWPSLEDLRAKVGDVWARDERDDILRLTPKGHA